jgi:hypothetical protein
MAALPSYVVHLVTRTYYDTRQLANRSRVLYSTRTRQIALLVLGGFLLLLWIDPRLYHSLAPRDVLPLVPVPSPSPQLAQRLNDLNSTLFEHYRSRGRTLPEQVFPYQALTRAQQTRYRLLASKPDGLFLFATLIRQVQDQIPDLLAALVVVVDTLGPQRVAFTFLEGPSDDLTPSVFNDVLQPLLLSLGVPSRRIRIVTDSPTIDFNNGNRIEILANLRNDALQPLWQDPALGTNVKSVVFFNDVYLKAEHMLELLYMHHVNGAGMTASWDWYKREPAYFYDVWVGRTVSKPTRLQEPSELTFLRSTQATYSIPSPMPGGRPPKTSSPIPPPLSRPFNTSSPSKCSAVGTEWSSWILNHSCHRIMYGLGDRIGRRESALRPSVGWFVRIIGRRGLAGCRLCLLFR